MINGEGLVSFRERRAKRRLARLERCSCSSCRWAKVRHALGLYVRFVNGSCAFLVAGYIAWRLWS